MVVARLVAVQDVGPRVRGTRAHQRRSRHARGAVVAVVVVPGAPLVHDGVVVWDTMAIGEYLNEVRPDAGLLPSDPVARAHCRAVCGEIHSGFVNLRSALPMNLKAHHPRLQGVGRRAGRRRPHHRDLAAVPRRVRRSVPVRRDSPRSPTRCTRRCARGSAPTTSSSTTRAARTATRSWRCRRCASGSPPREHEPDELEELDVEF